MTIILTFEIYHANNNGRYQNTDLYHLYCLFIAARAISAIWLLSPFAANLDLWLLDVWVLLIRAPTFCDTEPHFIVIRSHPSDWHPYLNPRREDHQLFT
jgi:hypothetical protein